MNSAILLLTLVLADTPKSSETSPNPTLNNCVVQLIDEAEVPGREAGVLEELLVLEGVTVKRGDLLGRIDDSRSIALRDVKARERDAAKRQAENDVNVRFATAASGVADAEYRKAIEANRQSRGSVPDIEVQKLKLAAKKASLQIEQSEEERIVAGLTRDAKNAEVKATEVDIKLRRISSPIDGVVEKVYKHVGEWAAPGDPVFRVIRLDRLRVKGTLKADDFGQNEIRDRNVVVEVKLARGGKAQFRGKVDKVDEEIQAGGYYEVWADIENRFEKNDWILHPGHKATMTILIEEKAFSTTRR